MVDGEYRHIVPDTRKVSEGHVALHGNADAFDAMQAPGLTVARRVSSVMEIMRDRVANGVTDGVPVVGTSAPRRVADVLRRQERIAE